MLILVGLLTIAYILSFAFAMAEHIDIAYRNEEQKIVFCFLKIEAKEDTVWQRISLIFKIILSVFSPFIVALYLPFVGLYKFSRWIIKGEKK
jgi:hypothetical protein